MLTHHCSSCVAPVAVDYHETSGGRVGHTACSTCGSAAVEDISEYHGWRLVPGHDWQFSHKDYDGPPDTRCGTAATLEDARRAVDEMIEEQE